ncbi:hypothetical protein H5410_033751 [Solanum commersonii]|uniref:Uncharacterized protein n=1 Tax=Solanum commersonii TaxID=4109 RepID=A0A9J5YR44_SOLCO|nr:hypothetical protein H5410_033751 [Solanum commersonii]
MAGGGGGGGGAAPAAKASEPVPHPPKDQLPNVSYCITSPPPWLFLSRRLSEWFRFESQLNVSS